MDDLEFDMALRAQFPESARRKSRGQKRRRAENLEKLRKVICSTCGDETGEVATDPVGVCAGCDKLARNGLLDGSARGLDYDDEPAPDEDWEEDGRYDDVVRPSEQPD